MYTMKEKIGIKLLYLCALHNISTKELSEFTSVSETIIKKIIQGQRTHLNANTLRKIVKKFDLSLSEFFEDPIFKD